MKQEQWKDVIGYEGLYKVSNFGKIVAYPRSCNDRWGNKRIIDGVAMKPQYSYQGYLRIALRNDKSVRNRLNVHRIVAMAFIDNPENKPDVNHINGIRDDNKVSNLEWCTQKENACHAYKFNKGGYRNHVLSNINSINEKNSYCRIDVIDRLENIYTFSSVSETSMHLGIKRSTILASINKKKSCYGYMIKGYKKN